MPTKAKSTPAPLNEDAVRDRAYLMWEADGRPEGMAEHYWMKAAAPDVGAKPKVKATAAKPKGKPAEATPAKARATSKSDDKPKLKAAAAKVSAPAVKVKPAAKAPTKKAAKKT